MKLLVDGLSDYTPDTEIIVESANGEKKQYIVGVFAQCETKNRNGRVYTKESMKNALSGYNVLIEDKRAMGELNHPDHPNVNLERASHLIESLKWDGSRVMGRARILTKLPMGKIAAGLLDEGVKLGVSTRGLGTLVERNGHNEVQNDYMMTAIDIVGDPSAPEAFVQSVMEGREWIYSVTAKSWILAEQIREIVKRTPSKRLIEAQGRAFDTFLRNLE